MERGRERGGGGSRGIGGRREAMEEGERKRWREGEGERV